MTYLELRTFVNKWIRNSAITPFQLLRLNTVLNDIIDKVEAGGGGPGGAVEWGDIQGAIADNEDLSQALADARSRANHTGTQTASTISDFQTAVSANTELAALKAIVGSSNADGDNIVNTLAEIFTVFQDFQEGVSLAQQLASKAPIESPTFTGTVGGINKSMVGLGNVDNTSDLNKPISNAVSTALNGKVNTDGSKVLSDNNYTTAEKNALASAALAPGGVLNAYDGGNLTNLPGLDDSQKSLSLKRFRFALSQVANREVVVRTIGTSLATFNNAPGKHFTEALQKQFGMAKSVYKSATETTSEQPVNGWLAQYYGGPNTTRLRGRSTDSATPLIYEYRGKSVTIFFGRESDGGNMVVSINGTPQSAISCNGSQSVHNEVTYQLDPYKVSTISIAPPSSGFGYFEAIMFENSSPYTKRGVRYDNMAFGGSGLKHMFSGSERVAGGGMATSQAISGSVGVNANFASASSLIKPDLIIISGFTNDLQGSSNDTLITAYINQLTTALTAANNAGIDVIFLMEPANGLSYPNGKGGVSSAGQSSTTQDDGTTQWGKARTQVINLIKTFTDKVQFIDWDYSLKQKAFADRFHSLVDLGDPHLVDNGFGDGYLIGGELICEKLGYSYPSKIEYADGTNEATAPYLSGASEPLFAPIETIWEDTSNGTGDKALLKRKVANLANLFYKGIDRDVDPKIPGTKALWHLIAGNPASDSVIIQVGVTTPSSGSWGTVTDIYPGVKQAAVTSSVAVQLGTAAQLIQNAYYTVSFAIRSSDTGEDLPAIVYVKCGESYLNFATELFDAALYTPHSLYVYPKSPVAKRYAVTFKWPSTAEQAALTGLGNTNTLRLQIGASSSPILVTDIRLDAGASVALPANLPISKLGTGTRNNTTVLYGDGVFRTPTAPPANIDRYIQTIQALGSPIKVQAAGVDMLNALSTTALASGTARVMAIYIPTQMTITGAVFVPTVAGNYTANNENKIGLYSYAAGELTLVAQTENDGNLWKNTINIPYQKAFTSPYNAAPGLYFVIMMYNSSAQTTAPTVKSDVVTLFPAYAPLVADFSTMFGTRALTTMPSTLAINTVSGVAARIWFGLY